MNGVMILFSLCVLLSDGFGVSEGDFDVWMTFHKKVYGSNAEKSHRYAVFRKNCAIIEAHNAEADDGAHSYRLGTNSLADMTNAEYRARLLGYRYEDIAYDTWSGELMVYQDMDVPLSIDWRTKGAVNHVKDQGTRCGSCWAFAATAAMEAAWFAKSGDLLSLSEQMCVDCASGGAYDCTHGGLTQACYDQIIRQGGDEQEETYPYTSSSHGQCNFNPLRAVTNFTSFATVAKNDEKALAAAVAKSVVAIAIDASSVKFQLYASGVYDNMEGCKSQLEDLDHAVNVVGYNGTIERNGDERRYWIVRNSWGPGWGMNGYVHMAKDKDNRCGVATSGTIPVVSP
jgi:cathepsin L